LFQSTYCVKAIQLWHGDINDDHHGVEPLSFIDESLAILNDSDELELFLEQTGQTLSEHFVVVSN
jgi:hypothetical protein